MEEQAAMFTFNMLVKTLTCCVCFKIIELFFTERIAFCHYISCTSVIEVIITPFIYTLTSILGILINLVINFSWITLFDCAEIM